MNSHCIKVLITLLFILLSAGVFAAPLSAQNDGSEETEVYLNFRHRGIINSMVIAYYKDEQFFLPISEIFSLVQVDHQLDGLTVTGNFSVKQTPYTINLRTNRITFGDRDYEITADDYLVKELDFYLRADLFYDIFGLDFTIDFSNLALNLQTSQELPAIEQAIRNQQRRVTDVTARYENYDLRFNRERPFLDGGFLDYNLSSNVSSSQNIYNFNTGLGLQVLGGDLQGSVFGSYSENFTSVATDNLRWRYMLRDKPWLTKLSIGQTTTDGLIRNNYTGIRLSNEPIEPRRLFDEFEVQGNTIPQSEVELYINNALIDFQQADELGNYRFLIPLTYGTSQLDLRIFGPTGQIIERSDRIQIPFTFQPEGVFNYTINTGQLDNPVIGSTERNFTAQGSGSYGITDKITAKAGIEYYEGFHDSLPTFTASVSSRILTNYILTAEAASNAYYRGVLNAIFPNAASFNVDYTDYTSDLGIYNLSSDDKRLVTSLFYPFNISGIPLNVRISSFSRIRESNHATTFRIDANSRLGKFNFRLGFRDRYTEEINPFNPSRSATIESSATYSISRNRNLPTYLRGAFLRAQMDYIPKDNLIESAEFLFSQNVFNQGRLQFSFGRNFINDFNNARFSLIIDFGKVRSSSTFNQIRGRSNFTQNVRGSVGYDSNYNNWLFTSRDQVGRSGAAIQLFVDNNDNGTFDDGDDSIDGNAVRVRRSGATSQTKNGVLYYTQMQPYYYYNLEMNKGAIQNPMLVPEFENFGMITDPNRFKKIEIPFYVSGVIEGVVERQVSEDQKRGVGGLRLMITQLDGDFSKEIRTFSDGSFYDYEIPPGKYELTVDPSQLEFLDVTSVPEKLSFEIEALSQGDFLDGLNITLRERDQDSGNSN